MAFIPPNREKMSTKSFLSYLGRQYLYYLLHLVYFIICYYTIQVCDIVLENIRNQNIRLGNLGSAARPGSGFYTPPFGYQPRRADNRKSCNLNGERLSCPGMTFARHVSVTSFELYCVTLSALYGWISLFLFEKNDDFVTKVIQIADLNMW